MKYIVLIFFMFLAIQPYGQEATGCRLSESLKRQFYRDAVAEKVIIEVIGEEKLQELVHAILRNEHGFNRRKFLRHSYSSKEIVAYISIPFRFYVSNITTTPKYVDFEFEDNTVKNWKKILNI